MSEPDGMIGGGQGGGKKGLVRISTERTGLVGRLVRGEESSGAGGTFLLGWWWWWWSSLIFTPSSSQLELIGYALGVGDSGYALEDHCTTVAFSLSLSFSVSRASKLSASGRGETATLLTSRTLQVMRSGLWWFAGGMSSRSIPYQTK
ncbi:unnamed protein product [Sphagnum tenellum]